MGQERIPLSRKVGMGGLSGETPAAHWPLPHLAISGLEPAPDLGGPASPLAHRIALFLMAPDSARFGLWTPPRSRPGCHGSAALPAASGLWVPQSPLWGAWSWGCHWDLYGTDTPLQARVRARRSSAQVCIINLRHITGNPAPQDLCPIPSAQLG